MCRYESMGYKVYMTRYNDSLGEMLGDKTLDNLDRRSLTIGYYGAVSKVVYSNHHNGSYNKGAHGYEMIVGNYFSENDLSRFRNHKLCLRRTDAEILSRSVIATWEKPNLSASCLATSRL